MFPLNQLTGSGLHIGFAKRNWIMYSERYLAGYRHNVAVFDIAITAFFLVRAFRFVEASVANYARGFFYGLNVNDRRSVKLFYKLGQIVSFHRWSGGFLTNIRRFKKQIRNFSKIPAFTVSMKLETRNYSVLREKSRLKVPLICPLDSNSNPAYAEYPIPSNASGRATVVYLGSCFAQAALSGSIRRVKCVFSERRNRSKKYLMRSRKRSYQGPYFERVKPTNEQHYGGRKRNRTAAVSFSGLYSTIELSPIKKK